MEENNSLQLVLKPYSQPNEPWVFDSLRTTTARVVTASTAMLFGALEGKVAISIFNVNGTMIMEEQMSTTKIQVDIGQLPSGMYFVKLISDETVEVMKVIKE